MALTIGTIATKILKSTPKLKRGVFLFQGKKHVIVLHRKQNYIFGCQEAFKRLMAHQKKMHRASKRDKKKSEAIINLVRGDHFVVYVLVSSTHIGQLYVREDPKNRI
jgi:hypothetical protein